jgi:hypothetical protein
MLQSSFLCIISDSYLLSKKLQNHVGVGQLACSGTKGRTWEKISSEREKGIFVADKEPVKFSMAYKKICSFIFNNIQISNHVSPRLHHFSKHKHRSLSNYRHVHITGLLDVLMVWRDFCV